MLDRGCSQSTIQVSMDRLPTRGTASVFSIGDSSHTRRVAEGFG